MAIENAAKQELTPLDGIELDIDQLCIHNLRCSVADIVQKRHYQLQQVSNA